MIKTFKGIEGYIELMNARNSVKGTPIRQMINGDAVHAFHEASGILDQVINKRVELQNTLLNLVRFEDRDLEVEKSNANLLKESRLLPEGSDVNSMYASFGPYLSIIDLDVENAEGILIENKNIVSNFNTQFDLVWKNADKN